MIDRPMISIEGLSRRFSDAGPAVFEDIWFGVDRGEFCCLIGHSGCGKTTILNVLAGLDRPSGGAVIVDNREIDGPSLDRAVIFQGHALLPWLSVMGNIAFAVSSQQKHSTAVTRGRDQIAVTVGIEIAGRQQLRRVW